jgi:RHS repeat-associated protein
VTSNYTYDPIYELTQVQQANSTTESYSYDPVGNRLSSLTVPSYSYNSSNEVTAAGGVMFTYDNNGNTTSKIDSSGTTSYTWDFENRLVGVTLPGSGGTATFKYDPFGRRIQKAFTQNGTTTTTNYLYDGDNVVETVDQNGNVLAHFDQRQSIDEPLAESKGGGIDYYEQDGLGSVTSLTNGAGQLAQTYTYDSYGNTTNSSGNVANPFRYTAREFDSETGLYYYRARYYDPSGGRFLAEDPIRWFGGGPNFYDYVQNRPVDWVDPLGLQALSYSAIANLVAQNNRSGQSDDLIICVIYKESSFNPKSHASTSSAQGLMGVENGAAKDMGAAPGTLTNPAINIQVGSGYLKGRINSRPPFGGGGNVASGLAKYGTGPGYASSILQCEKCLNQNSNESCKLKTSKCLLPLHGGK